MNIVSDLKSYTASEARDRLYTLIKAAATGLKSFEITLRGSNPVLIISREEFESWQETFDVLGHKKEITSLRKARRQERTVSHKNTLRQIGMDHEA